MNYSLLQHVGQHPLVQLMSNKIKYKHTIKLLLVSSALVAPSLVLMGSTGADGSLSSAVSFTDGALNIHSCAKASTSDRG